MRIFGFITQYCTDLVEAAKMKRKLVDLGEYPHDDIIKDADGKDVPIVLVDGNEIPVADFFTMDRADFVHAWKTPSAGDAYDNYVSALYILEGADVIDRIRNAILKETEMLEKDVDMFMSFDSI